jgi:hypothetical protein
MEVRRGGFEDTFNLWQKSDDRQGERASKLPVFRATIATGVSSWGPGLASKPASASAGYSSRIHAHLGKTAGLA